MDRLTATQKVFDDLRTRVSVLPRLRHKAMQDELNNVLIIINQLERAFVTHLTSDLSEEENLGIIEKTIRELSTPKTAVSEATRIRMHLKRNFQIAISEKALMKRIKNFIANANRDSRADTR